MTNMYHEQNNNEEQNISESSQKKVGVVHSLIQKYPYLMAYIAFLLWYFIARAAAALIFLVPGIVFVEKIDFGVYMARAEFFILALQLVLAFYAFRSVVKKIPFLSK